MTEWRPCAEFPDYEISEDGVVRRLTDSDRAKRGHVLRPKTDRYGYYTVRPFYNGIGRHITVHRLVALAFLGDPPTPDHQVAHFDGDHKHNHYSNLRWATSRENNLDKRRHGRVVEGSRHWRRRLSDEAIAAICKRYLDGKAGLQPPIRQKDLGKEFGVPQSYISWLTRGRGRGHASRPSAGA